MHQFLELPNLEKYQSENPNSIVFAFLAFRNLEQGNVEKALSICEQGVEKYPQYPFGHFVLGLCHYHLGDFSKAKRHLELSIAHDDKNPKAWKLLGEINEKLDLSLLAEECNLNYYLLDSFNPDALEKYQKEELIDFNAFRTDFSPEDLPPTEVKGDSEILEDESGLGTLFDSSREEEGDLNLSGEAKLENEFEEAPGEIFSDKEDEASEPEYQQSPDQEKEDWMESDHTKPEMKSKDKQTEVEQAKVQDTSEDETVSADEEKDIFSEADESEPDAEQSDDLLDFKSVVKDIISEDQQDIPETLGQESEPAEEVEPSAEPPEQLKTEQRDKTVDRPSILTPTIGEIYIAQGRFDEAVNVFEQLLEMEPDNKRYQKKIKDVEAIIEKQKLRSIGD